MHTPHLPKCCLTNLHTHTPYTLDTNVASYLVAADAIGLLAKFWPVGKLLRVYFIDGTHEEKEQVMRGFKEWSKYANLLFIQVDEWEDGSSDIRISMDPRRGAWSYIGTDCEHIHWTKPTMNLGWIDTETILHEIGHCIGLLHEHQNIFGGGFKWNKQQVYKDLSGPPNNWPKDRIDWNMFHLYSKDLVRGTDIDRDSIMMYFFPASWTMDGNATPQNTSISDTDKKFISEVYPYHKEDPEDEEIKPGPSITNALPDILREALPQKYYMKYWRHHTLEVIADELGVDVELHKSKNRLKDRIWEVIH